MEEIEQMRVFFRVDSSQYMGSGHIMRCLTLADGLKRAGVLHIEFICRELPGNLINLIEQRYLVHRLAFNAQIYVQEDYKDEYAFWLGGELQQDADETKSILTEHNCNCLIIDHYRLDMHWEKQMRSFCQKIMVIDDVANREHDCDILLDQNFYLNMEQRYKSLVPDHCQQLLGPQYALLRPEFREIREKRMALGKDKLTKIKNILVFMGGADPSNITLKILHNFPGKDIYSGKVNVVVGQANSHRVELEAHCQQDDRMCYHLQPDYYSNLLLEADLAIGAGGSSSWERCCVGLPMLLFCLAANQRQICHDLSKKNYISYVESFEDFFSTLECILVREFSMVLYSSLTDLVDGLGVGRVISSLGVAADG